MEYKTTENQKITKRQVVWNKKGAGNYTVFLENRDVMVEMTILKLALVFALTLVISAFGMWEKPTPFFDIAGPMRILFTVSVIAFPSLTAFYFRDRLKRYLFHVTPREWEIITFFKNILESQGLSSEETQSSVSFEFELLPNGIEIIASTHGTGMVDKIRDLDRALEDRFAMELISKKDEVNFVTYTLKSTGSEDRLIAPIVGSRCKEGEVPIDVGLKWNMNKCPHGLIAGNTGGGKTYFIFYLLSYFIKKGYTLYICDPKRSDLTMSERYFLGHSVFLEYSPGGIARNIRLAKEEMLKRYEDIADNWNNIGSNYRSLDYKPIILLVDEFGGYLASCDKKTRTEVLDNLKQLIFQGRQAGVFVILSTQKPDADTIPTNIRDQLGLRAVLGNMTTDGYRMVFGSHEGMSYKSKDSGEGYIYFDGLGSDRPVPFKAPLIEDLDSLMRFCTHKEVDYAMPVSYPGD